VAHLLSTILTAHSYYYAAYSLLDLVLIALLPGLLLSKEVSALGNKCAAVTAMGSECTVVGGLVSRCAAVAKLPLPSRSGTSGSACFRV